MDLIHRRSLYPIEQLCFLVSLITVAITAHRHKSVAVVIAVFVLRLTTPASVGIDHLSAV